MSAGERFTGGNCLGIVSPAARQLPDGWRKRWQERFGELRLTSPESVEQLGETIARSREDYPLVLVIGGDGTISQVVQRLDLGSQTLAILPAGTGNDLARGLGLPLRIARYMEKLSGFAVREIDVWRINGRRFVNSAGFGLDAQVLATMASSRGLVRRKYVLAFLAALPGLHPLHLKAGSTETTLVDGAVWWLVALNSPFVGGGIPLAPQARLDDGNLEIVIIHACSKWELLLKLPGVMRGRHLKDRRVSSHQVRSLRVESAQQPVELEGDGELLKLSGSHCELTHAGRLRILGAAVDTH